jgi:hypothetical protein
VGVRRDGGRVVVDGVRRRLQLPLLLQQLAALAALQGLVRRLQGRHLQGLQQMGSGVMSGEPNQASSK